MVQLVGALGVLLVFGGIIAIHEFGHFLLAKWSKMGVEEFSLGFGTPLWQREYHGTLYALRIIPLGGYVRITGMEIGEDAYQENGFENKPFYAKFATLLAGVFMNFVLALIVLVIMGLAVGFPTNQTKVGRVEAQSPAALVGLHRGDLLVQVGNARNPTPEVTADIIHHSKLPLPLLIERQGKFYPFTVTPIVLPGSADPRIGIQLETPYKPAPPGQAIIRGVVSVYQSTRMMVYGLWLLVTGHISLKNGGVMGPVGIIHMTDQVSQRALSSKEAMADFLLLFALISMNVGIVNLLPIPALDGSRLLFLVIEKIIRRPFNKQIEAMVHMVGLMLLLSLIAFISVFDIWNWVHPLKGPH